MPNAFQAVINYIKSTSVEEDPKQNPHIGEAMGCWLYYTSIAEEIPALETCLNTTTDNELIELLTESKRLAEHQKLTLEKFMIKEGIPLSNTAQSKPNSDPNNIPLGVKSTNDEIANLISIKVASNIMMCSTNMTQSIRNDIGLMWARFYAEKMIFSMNLKNTMHKRGWLKIPPYFHPPGAPRS
ncbi:DUF3231 family protein [Cytobacillus sp. Sa5YUA1]|uniref:DUF3231 family protein n=1 Tax=Cytobacillus stercorigallinarum TaxID=2762240 RepID=A0ABR8QN41_9BACI|nr:DUF3231 family protein [Cytobacillus stercorigallinarum]MBD7936936.1 DUF3231 family protein [Cytobacillus stercorigallinarum]